MKTVYKYPFQLGRFTLAMPKGARFLLVEVQAGIPCIWAAVDTAAEQCQYRFETSGTGSQIPENSEHVGSFQDRQFVWHIWRLL